MNTKVTIACPTNRGIRPKTAECLMRLIAHGGYDFHCIVPSEGYTIAENRNYIAAQSCKNGSEYLLMVDDDMTFDSDLLDMLIANDKDICGVAYTPRTENAVSTKYLDETHCQVLDEHENDPENQQVRECHATGTGVILIKTSVFRRMTQPFFMFEYYDNGCVKVGEDWWFCIKAKQFGIQTWFDPTVRVGHLGEKLYQRKKFENNAIL